MKSDYAAICASVADAFGNPHRRMNCDRNCHPRCSHGSWGGRDRQDIDLKCERASIYIFVSISSSRNIIMYLNFDSLSGGRIDFAIASEINVNGVGQYTLNFHSQWAYLTSAFILIDSNLFREDADAVAFVKSFRWLLLLIFAEHLLGPTKHNKELMAYSWHQ